LDKFITLPTFADLKAVAAEIAILFKSRAFVVFACLVLGLNLFVIGADVGVRLLRNLHILGAQSGTGFAVSGDDTPAELLGYVEFSLAALLLLVTGLKRRNHLLLFWSALVAYLTCDDFLHVHDQARVLLGGMFFSDTAYFGATELGELMYASIVGLGALLGFMFCLGSTPAKERVIASLMAIPVGLLIFCAVGLDQLNPLLARLTAFSGSAENMLRLLEDGGELMSMGLALVFACGLNLLAYKQFQYVISHTPILSIRRLELQP
jgi:hypothetical protein